MIGRVRKISGDLRPPLLDEVGLIPALRAYVDAQTALSGVRHRARRRRRRRGRRPPPGRRPARIACFRVVQESLTNALRHAAPRRIQVSVIHGPAVISLSISDDGHGFDATAQRPAGHLGVVGMQERVRARGGSFRISSRPGKGTIVDVEMPLHSAVSWPSSGPFRMCAVGRRSAELLQLFALAPVRRGEGKGEGSARLRLSLATFRGKPLALAPPRGTGAIRSHLCPSSSSSSSSSPSPSRPRLPVLAPPSSSSPSAPWARPRGGGEDEDEGTADGRDEDGTRTATRTRTRTRTGRCDE